MDKINWINGQSGGTPLSAENLNLMQDNIEAGINAKGNEIIGTLFGNENVYFSSNKSYSLGDYFMDGNTNKLYKVTTAFSAGDYSTVASALSAGVITQSSILVN